MFLSTLLQKDRVDFGKDCMTDWIDVEGMIMALGRISHLGLRPPLLRTANESQQCCVGGV